MNESEVLPAIVASIRESASLAAVTDIVMTVKSAVTVGVQPRPPPARTAEFEATLLRRIESQRCKEADVSCEVRLVGWLGDSLAEGRGLSAEESASDEISLTVERTYNAAAEEPAAGGGEAGAEAGLDLDSLGAEFKVTLDQSEQLTEVTAEIGIEQPPSLAPPDAAALSEGVATYLDLSASDVVVTVAAVGTQEAASPSLPPPNGAELDADEPDAEPDPWADWLSWQRMTALAAGVGLLSCCIGLVLGCAARRAAKRRQAERDKVEAIYDERWLDVLPPGGQSKQSTIAHYI